MLIQDLKSILVLFNLQAKLSNKSNFLTHLSNKVKHPHQDKVIDEFFNHS